MNKIFTRLVLLGAVCLMVFKVSAQVPQPLSSNIIGQGAIGENLGSPRLVVNSPSSLKGIKKITIATWGSQGSPAVINMPVVRGTDSLAAYPLTNGAAISGKVCLLYRGGGITFAQKVQYAVAAGAIAVIIVNNVSGDPVGMGNTGTTTYSVPIVMVSDVDGNAINNAIIGGNTVNVTIGGWQLIAGHDLALLPGYQSTPHALNIPLSQLSAGASRLPYRNFVGGAVMNRGTFTESGVSVIDTVTWNPATGPASVVHTGSYSVPTIAPIDSIMFGFGSGTSSWSLPAISNTGYITYKYNISYPNSDTLPDDNSYSFNQYVTDSIFCKGRYDYAKNQPIITLGIRPAATTVTVYSFGPLYYVAKGKYYARKLQYYISNGGTTLAGEESYGLLFKWTDGSNTQPLDSFVQGDELKLVGIARKAYSSSDSVGQTTTVTLAIPGTNKAVVLDSNAWYLTSVQTTQNCFVGVDEGVSYFTRSYIQSRQYGNNEMPELLYLDDYPTLSGNNTALAPYPFNLGSAYNIDSVFYDRFYYVPNVALHLSKNQQGVGVGNVVRGEVGTMHVFPVPATNVINVDLKLTTKARHVAYRLLGLNGQVAYKQDRFEVTHDVLSIPCDNLAAGIYYLAAFTDDGGNVVERVVIGH